jgi:hypothetical protein
MTSIVAIVSGYFLYTASAWVALALVVAFGLAQMTTKSQMNEQYKAALHAGRSPGEALQRVSDRTTRVNMGMTVGVWAMAVYAAFLKLS